MSTLQFISDELIFAIGSTLLHSLWQAAIVSTILLILLRVVPKKSAQLKYWLGITALTAIVFWTGYTLKEQIMPLVTDTPITTAVAVETWQIGPNLQAVASYKLPLMQQFLQDVMVYLEPYMASLVIVWLLGMLLLLVRLQGSMIYLSRLRSTSITAVPLAWQWRVKELGYQLGVNKPVALVESGLAEIPMVIGHLKPIILLPLGMLSGLPARDLEAVIAHELAHVKRYDYLINIVQTLIESLLFFNPMVWWVSHVIRTQREHCCDDLAVKCCGNHMIYAHALTNLGAWSLKTPTLSMGLFKNRNELFKRVKRLVYPQSTTSIKEKFVPLMVLVMTLCCFTWYSLQVQAQFASGDRGLEVMVSPITNLLESNTSITNMVADTVPELEEVEDVEELAPMEPTEDSEEALEQEWIEDMEVSNEFEFDFKFDEFSELEIPEIPELAELAALAELAEIVADVNVIVDEVVSPDLVVELADVPDIMVEELFLELNDTTKKKIREALEAHRETLEKVRLQQSEALEKARVKLQMSLSQERPENLTEAEWEEAKIRIKSAERQLQQVREQTERALEQALRERERTIEVRREQIDRVQRDQDRAARNRVRHIQRHVERGTRDAARSSRNRVRSDHQDLRRELVKDGFIDSIDDDFKVTYKKDTFKVNGKKLSGDLKEKYLKMLELRYGKDSAVEIHYSKD